MTIEQGDAIIVIDGRSELKWWKGQNQRTYEISIFPRYYFIIFKLKNIHLNFNSIKIFQIKFEKHNY